MNEKKKKRLVGAFVVMTAFVMVVVMALEATRCLFPSLQVEQSNEDGAGSKAHQRLLLGALTEEEMAQYRMLPEEKRRIVNLWMDADLKRMLLTDEMLEKMMSLDLTKEKKSLLYELRQKVGLTRIQARAIVTHLSEISETCVPICFQEDVPTKARLTTVRKERLVYITKYAEMKSEAFPDTRLIGYKTGNGKKCCFSTLEHWYETGTQQGFANRQNEGALYVKAMRDATNELRDLGDGNDLDAQSRILIIGHGIGYLPYVLQNSFPDVHIDSVDIDQAVFQIANQWFCYHKMMDGNLKVEKIVADGRKYFEKLKTGEKEEKYDVIHLDVYDSDGTIPYFEGKEFFRSVDKLWKSWNGVEPRPRMLVINGYHEDLREITKTSVYQNAVEIFGPDRVKVHAHTIFSVTSVDRVKVHSEDSTCVDDGWILDLFNVLR